MNYTINIFEKETYMLVNNESRLRKTSAKLSDQNIEIINAYIKGAVHGFCNNNSGIAFSVRSLFGEDNRDWSDTPLQEIYEYFINLGYDRTSAAKRAAVNVGLLLKNILITDKKFEYKEYRKRTNEYVKIE